MNGEMVIEARGLTKRFGRVVALDDIDLNVPRGAAYGLLGPAGSGKSTIVRLVAGVARPSAGTLVIAGSPGGTVAARRHLGVLLQDAQLYGWMTGREALAFAADLAGVASTDVAGRIEDVAGQLALADVLDRRVEAIAAPARGRLAIAQALVGEPEILVLDEPFHWLDPEGRAEVVAVLRELRGSTTILLATHRSADVEALCDRVDVLEAGRVLRSSKVIVRAATPPASTPVIDSPHVARRPAGPSVGKLTARLLSWLFRELRR